MILQFYDRSDEIHTDKNTKQMFCNQELNLLSVQPICHISKSHAALGMWNGTRHLWLYN